MARAVEMNLLHAPLRFHGLIERLLGCLDEADQQLGGEQAAIHISMAIHDLGGVASEPLAAQGDS